jgi:hypothetical protein
MDTCELPVDKWDKLNKDLASPCYRACLLVEPLAQGMNHARRSRRQIYR